MIMKNKKAPAEAANSKRENTNKTSLLNLPLEVVEMIFNQLATNPKTTVMDYYGWLTALGSLDSRISELIKKRVFVYNMCEEPSEFLETFRESAQTSDFENKVTPSCVNHMIIAIDEDIFERNAPNQIPNEIPQLYGDVKVYLAYHYTGDKISLRKIHDAYVDHFPHGCMRPCHIITIARDSTDLFFEANDGNMFDSYFYPDAQHLFKNITFFNAKTMFFEVECLSSFAQVRQPHLRYDCQSGEGAYFVSLADGKRYHSSGFEHHAARNEYECDEYGMKRSVEKTKTAMSSEYRKLMGKSYLKLYLDLSISCPQVKVIKFGKKGRSNDDLNTIDIYHYLTNPSDYTLQEFFNFHSMRGWHLPSIEHFGGHNFLWHTNTGDNAERYRKAKSLIPKLRTRIQNGSPDGLLHINAQLVPDGAVHTTVSNWIPLDVAFDHEISKSGSPLICLRQPCLKSLKLELMVTKPEGCLVIEGLYLPRLERLETCYDTDLVQSTARNPIYNVIFSDWNDLTDCKNFSCDLKESFKGIISVFVPNLTTSLPLLNIEKGTKSLEQKHAILFTSKGFPASEIRGLLD
ncbi:LAME_0E01178g1_1 [Lachancea meyersii CBS 8951]|uniref:LAME_0E01178g1_1 n=1 Tax=Lachancea meyersii CBS 8951 TaxID=1266667 RepID=A0A1G4JEW5_9SACH|nr:LAME_0E01178g1_1 [Lachancea meyersii CBS 8951]